MLVANGSGGDGWRQDVLPIRMGGGHIPELLVGRSVLHIGQPEGRKDKSAAFDGSQFNGWSQGRTGRKETEEVHFRNMTLCSAWSFGQGKEWFTQGPSEPYVGLERH